MTLLLPEIAQSCSAQKWPTEILSAAFVDRVNVLKTKKFVELGHGFGSLFNVGHWRLWLASVLRIFVRGMMTCCTSCGLCATRQKRRIRRTHCRKEAAM
ncbi:unnamed protein product [Amoebophrya sp. A25]|nr:unnamed protein product [Amoebophrya sp. A25]|eukprot:GSA25T00015118001.1